MAYETDSTGAETDLGSMMNDPESSTQPLAPDGARDGTRLARVAVCIATYRRPTELRKLLETVGGQILPEHYELQIRVVDNDADGSAREVVDAASLPPAVRSRLTYVIETERGIAEARNRALDIGPAEFYVFVDDDEWVEERWLESLLETAEHHRGDVVLGPVTGILPSGAPKWMERGGFFNKETGQTGTILDWTGTRTSNTLVRGTWMVADAPAAKTPAMRFDRSFSRSGGSDCELFRRMEDLGAKFVACEEARVFEFVEPERASLGWLTKRFYRTGLVYHRIAHDQNPTLRLLKRLLRISYTTLTAMPQLLTGKVERLVRARLQWSVMKGGFDAARSADTATSWVEYKDKTLPSATDQPKH
ncbi:MAG: glycosyltransferase family 2 protein [Planctomycetota bacterium]